MPVHPLIPHLCCTSRCVTTHAGERLSSPTLCVYALSFTTSVYRLRVFPCLISARPGAPSCIQPVSYVVEQQQGSQRCSANLCPLSRTDIVPVSVSTERPLVWLLYSRVCDAPPSPTRQGKSHFMSYTQGCHKSIDNGISASSSDAPYSSPCFSSSALICVAIPALTSTQQALRKVIRLP